MSRITEILMEELSQNVEKSIDELKTALDAKIEGIKTTAFADIKQLEAFVDSEKPLIVNLGTIEKPKRQLVHKAFKTITKILQSTKRKEKNIMMVGGAGGGKTHLAKSVADALKLKFYPMSVGLQTTKSDLLGFINANGIYMPSPIRLAYENGGVLLLDEFDSAHAGVITILNSLLANGHCSFPDGTILRHKDFICLCACNTYGKGGTIDYVGRNRLDAATLDRFIIVDVDYDNNLEKKLTNNELWFGIVKQIREQINKQGIKMIVSPRASMDGADLLDAGFKMQEVIDMCIFKGCDKDIKTKIMKNIKIPTSVSVEQMELEIPDEEVYDINIDVDLDNYMYNCNVSDEVAKRIEENNRDIRLPDNYTIAIGKAYSTYLSDKILWVNRNQSGGLSLQSSDEKNFDGFMRALEKQKELEASESCKYTMKVQAKYKDEIVTATFRTN